jgi:hypothetical protein
MNNNFVNRICTINDAVGENRDGAFERDFLSTTEPTTFVLEDLSLGGGLVGFTAHYVGKNPPAFWTSPITFVGRGSAPPSLSPGSEKPLLPPWQAAQGGAAPPLRQTYADALKDLLSWTNVHPSFAHLQGEVVVDGETEAVNLYLFPAGVINDKDFVLIEVKADEEEVNARQSGVGHGNF